MQEYFSPIPGLPGFEASSEGRIFGPRRGKGKFELKQWNRCRGYRGVTITLNGKTKSFLVHRLVLLAFSGPPPSKKHEAIHLDNSRANNRISNLKWGLHFENMLLDRGHNHSHRGINNPNSKLTIENVREIRTAYDVRRSYKWGRKALADKFGISSMQIGLIAKRRNGGWKEQI